MFVCMWGLKFHLPASKSFLTRETLQRPSGLRFKSTTRVVDMCSVQLKDFGCVNGNIASHVINVLLCIYTCTSSHTCSEGSHLHLVCTVHVHTFSVSTPSVCIYVYMYMYTCLKYMYICCFLLASPSPSLSLSPFSSHCSPTLPSTCSVHVCTYMYMLMYNVHVSYSLSLPPSLPPSLAPSLTLQEPGQQQHRDGHNGGCKKLHGSHSPVSPTHAHMCTHVRVHVIYMTFTCTCILHVICMYKHRCTFMHCDITEQKPAEACHYSHAFPPIPYIGLFFSQHPIMHW